MTLERRVRLFVWAMTTVASLVFIAMLVGIYVITASSPPDVIDPALIGAAFLGFHLACAPLLWLALGAGLLDAKLDAIRDGARPGPVLHRATFEPPARGRKR